MTPATGWTEESYFAASRNARAAFDRANPQLSFGALEEGVDRADGGSAAAPSSSAPYDGNPRGHPPDDQRHPASSLSAWGRDNGALDLSAEEVAACTAPTTVALTVHGSSASAEPLTTSGPPAPPPKEDSGRAEGGHSK